MCTRGGQRVKGWGSGWSAQQPYPTSSAVTMFGGAAVALVAGVVVDSVVLVGFSFSIHALLFPALVHVLASFLQMSILPFEQQ